MTQKTFGSKSGFIFWDGNELVKQGCGCLFFIGIFLLFAFVAIFGSDSNSKEATSTQTETNKVSRVEQRTFEPKETFEHEEENLDF